MKKTLTLLALFTVASMAMADGGRLEQDKQISVNSKFGTSRLSEYGAYKEISADYLFGKTGNTFYGVTAGWMTNKFDDSGSIRQLNEGWVDDNPYEQGDFNVNGILVGATAKHYLTDNIFVKGTAGYQFGSSEKEVKDPNFGYKESIKSDMTSPFASVDLAYEFNNGISLGGFYKVSRVEYSATGDIEGANKKNTNQVWGFTSSYTF